MSWVLVGSTAIATGGAIAGGLLSGGGGGGGGGGYQGVPIEELERIAKENARKVQAGAYGTVDAGTIRRTGNKKDGFKFEVVNKDGKVLKTFDNKDKAQKFINNRKGKPQKAPPLIPTITKLSDQFVKQVDRQVAAGKKELNAEEKKLLDRIKGHDARLNKAQDQEDRELQRDLAKITADFEAGMNLLDEQDRQEFGAALNDFNQQAQQVTDAYDERSTGIVDAADEERRGQIERFGSDSTSLGDRYLDAAGAAGTSFDQAFADSLDLSPERLAQFTEAADFISKQALQTRMDMLATADPRALELSAIADENAAAMMSGRISADMQANLARSSAMRALSGGFGAGSEMGRGLAARDLGLTSLDLMREGTQMYDNQRRLNYDTRVAGVAEGAGANAGAFLANDQRARQTQALTNFEAALGVAQSDRDQRQGALVEGLRTDQLRVADRTRDNLGVAGTVLQSGLETNRFGFDARQNNIGARTARGANRLTNIFDRNFVSRQGVYDQNLNTARQINTSNINAAGSIFDTRSNAIYQDTANRINARSLATGNKIATRTGVFDATNAARQSGAATMTSAIMQNWAANNAWKASNVSNNQAMGASLINAGGSIFGSLAGNMFNSQASMPYGAQAAPTSSYPYQAGPPASLLS